jgi:hypothetical protein
VPPLTHMPYALLTDPTASGRVYAGLSIGEGWYATDYGHSWQHLPLNLGSIDRTLLLLPAQKENPMFHRTFWTLHRFTGLTLLLGSVLGLAGAGMPVGDSKGIPIYSLPFQQWPRIIFDHPLLWQWAALLFLSGIVVTILGLDMLSRLLRDAGDRTFSRLGLITFVFGAVLWVIMLAFRLGLDPWAAQQTARTGVVPDYYMPLIVWTHTLLAIYTVLAFAALVAYAGAVLSTGVLPHWVGWIALVYGLAGLGFFGFTGDSYPLMHHLLPILMGILLLLRRSELPARSHREEAPPVVEPSAVPGEQA